MKRNLTILALTFLVTGALAQNEMMHLPNGSLDISTTTSGDGVAIGSGFSDPEGRLHIQDDSNGESVLFLDAVGSQREVVGPGGSISFVNISPDFLIRARNQPYASSASFKFSVDLAGRIQSGLYNAAINEQLAVLNNMAIYRGSNQKLRFELSNNEPRFLWKSPGNNFQFVNQDNATVALQLGEGGEVGVNTGTFTTSHKLHVAGGALADYSVVQPAANWISGGNYLGMYFSDRPEIRWDSDATEYFEFKAADTGEVPLRLSSAGKVGINTDCFSGTHSLFIEGSAIAEEIFVQLKDDWCDYVFEEDYYLRPLDEVENYIKENGHLPNIPSASEIEETGIPLGEMERLLTEKVEELTLYILELKKEIDTLKEEIKD